MFLTYNRKRVSNLSNYDDLNSKNENVSDTEQQHSRRARKQHREESENVQHTGSESCSDKKIKAFSFLSRKTSDSAEAAEG